MPGESSRLGYGEKSVSALERVKQRREIGVLVAFLAMVLLMAITRPDIFFTWDKVAGIYSRLLRQVAGWAIIGIGMSFLIIGGEFDLSVGSMFALGGVAFTLLIVDFGLPVSVALLLTLIVGILIGATNGLLVTKAGVPSLIATIGMLSVLRGVVLWFTPGGSVQVPNLGIFQSILAFDINIIGVVISAQAIWAILLMLVFGLILQYTKFGNHVYATGDDKEASRLNGIDVEKVKITNFILTSTLAAFAGILSVAYFGSIFSAAGRGIELTIIAGVIIGGTNLFGGEGSISGTFLGMLVIGFIPTLLVINNVAVEIGDLFTGAIIILAVIIDSLLR